MVSAHAKAQRREGAACGRTEKTEEQKIKEVLHSYLRIAKEDYPILLAAIRQAAIEQVDFYQFAREIGKIISQDAKDSVIKNLFRIAYADKKMHKNELEIIRNISALFNINQPNLSALEADIKRELGIAESA